jgi:hypothetical protein
MANTPEAREKREIFLRVLAEGATEAAAAKLAGFSHRQYSRLWQGKTNDTPEGRRKARFRQRIKFTLALCRARLEIRAYRGALRDPALALQMLKARYPMDWNPEVVVRLMLGLKDEDPGIDAAPLPTFTVRRDLTLEEPDEDFLEA